MAQGKLLLSLVQEAGKSHFLGQAQLVMPQKVCVH